MNSAAIPTWRLICHSVNLLAVATSLLSLSRRQLLPFQPFRVGQLEGNQGYLHGLFRCLDSLGWADRRGAEASPCLEVELTGEGRRLLADLSGLELVNDWLEQAGHFLRGDFRLWSPPPADLGLVSEVLQAARLAPLVLFSLLQPDQQLPPGPRQLLHAHLWQDAGGEWTPRGRAGLALGAVFHYPFAYLQTLLQADALLFGDAQSLRRRSGGVEEHVDRERDILFSGQVFTGSVASVFWELFLPIFESHSPPRAVVDLGCGDGLMLAELGRRLDPSVLLVGVEYNQVARQTAARTLAAFPHHRVIEGDIGNPGELVARLREMGVAHQEVVFVTKSVIHNRPYRPARQPSGRAALGRTAVADGQGAPIDNADLEASLVEFFADWKRFLGGHGLLAVEAHTVPCPTDREHFGRTLSPCLDLTHCYSNQLLVEAAVYRDCARRAGLTSEHPRELGAAAFGHAHMTVDHWKVAP